MLFCSYNFNIRQQMSNFSDKFEQVDGANEVTPKKIHSKRKPHKSQSTPPQENKRQKYTPLQIAIVSSPKSNSSKYLKKYYIVLNS